MALEKPNDRGSSTNKKTKENAEYYQAIYSKFTMTFPMTHIHYVFSQE